MINFIGKLPDECTLAFSGGVDSVAIADFLLNGKRKIDLAFFHHGTKTSDEAQEFVIKFAKDRNVKLHLGKIDRKRHKEESQEEYWRNERLKFFRSFKTILTAHHLDDAIETWIFTSLHGESRLIPYRNENVLRPFLITPKAEFESWCKRRGISWCEDESNKDVKFMRNLVRHKIVPEALLINPGLRKVIKKKYLSMRLE